MTKKERKEKKFALVFGLILNPPFIPKDPHCHCPHLSDQGNTALFETSRERQFFPPHNPDSRQTLAVATLTLPHDPLSTPLRPLSGLHIYLIKTKSTQLCLWNALPLLSI
jgi:hypothetical protein